MPWQEEYWNLYITNPISTTQIWARIIGQDYSDKMDSSLNDIEMEMLTEKQKATTIQASHIYLIALSECWHRVRVDQINEKECLCFFIDTGEEEWHPFDELHVCAKRFLKVPPQAVICSLFGLEDFDENPNAKPQLELLMGKTLIAKIISKKDEYELQDKSCKKQFSFY